MLACDAVSAVVVGSVPVAAWCGMFTLAQLLAAAILAGTSVLFSTAYGVYLPLLVPRDDFVEANTKLQGSRSAAPVAGPGAAGLIAQLLGAVAGLVADAATFVVSASCSPLSASGGVGGALVALRIALRFGTARGMLICTLGTVPFGLLVTLTGPGPRLALFAVGRATVSAGLVASSIIARSFRQFYCPAPLLGGLTATMSTVTYSATPLGALLAASWGPCWGAAMAFGS